MTHWTDGYYQELNPLRTQLAFVYAGLVPLMLGVHCELGFGQGLSVNIHAAASGSTWHGCDFNPAQTSFAQSLAWASGAPAHLSDETFAEFCTCTDLPSFDSIGLHGIWSWINDDNRAVIVDFVRRKLKVGHACSAFYTDHIDTLNVSPEQAKLMNEVADPLFRETVRDFMVVQQFRKDYWVKGVRRLSPLERVQALRAQRVLPTQPRDTVPTKINGTLGEGALQEDIYNPILELLSDHQPRTLGEIEQAVQIPAKANAKPNAKGVNFAQLAETIMILAGAGIVSTAQDETTIARAKPYTQRLNTHFLEMACSNDTAHDLASLVTGAGVTVLRFGQLFLLAIQQGMQQHIEWAQFTWQVLQEQGQKLVHECTTLESAAGNRAELSRQAKTFESTRLPVLRALQIV